MLSFLYSLSLAFGILGQSRAPSDVPVQHWAYKSVDDLFRAGILHGYPQGSFHGNDSVSNYEMASALGSLLGSEERQINGESTGFRGEMHASSALELLEIVRALGVESPGAKAPRNERSQGTVKPLARKPNGDQRTSH